MKKITNLEEILKFGTILFFPLRDILGFYIGESPIRLGELWAAFYIIILFYRGKLKNGEIFIALFLCLNLLLVFVGNVFNVGNIDQGFSTKYIFRNIFNILFIIGFLCSKIDYSADDITRIIKYTFYIEMVMFVLLYATHHGMYIGHVYGWDSILATGQVVNIGGLIIPRFSGTSSEPGYLTALLPMMLYFFIVNPIKKYRLYLMGTGIMILFTFSSAVYFATFMVVVYLLVVNKKIPYKYLVGIIAILIIGLLVYLVNGNIRSMLDDMVINKIFSFFNGDKSNYSATERNLQMINAYNLFLNGDLIKQIIGWGTGGYLYNTLHYGIGLYSYDVEEAYNLYLSTLVDRGMVGLVLLMCFFKYLSTKRIKYDIYSNTIFVAILIQMCHWMITGNLWQYYFWAEVVILIGYNRFYRRKKVVL